MAACAGKAARTPPAARYAGARVPMARQDRAGTDARTSLPRREARAVWRADGPARRPVTICSSGPSGQAATRMRSAAGAGGGGGGCESPNLGIASGWHVSDEVGQERAADIWRDVPVVSGQVRVLDRLPLKWGGELSDVSVAYRLLGPADAPAVLVLGGISAGRHATASADDPTPGWWELGVGSGRPIDTERYRVLTLDYLSGRGETSAAGAEGLTSIDTRDQAAVCAALLGKLGIDRVRAVIGTSYGGMVALAFAAEHANLAGHAVIFGAAHDSHPMATAWRAIQRDIVRLGMSAGDDRAGVRIARALAITTYRSAAEFARRFDATPERTPEGYRFPVEAYLQHQGNKFADAFSATKFLVLSESCDLHRIDPAEVGVPTSLVAVDSDILVPTWQMRQLAEALPDCRGLHEVASDYGHDAFLIEESVVSVIGAALDRVG